MPERIQRKREKGWRMPENTIYVGRGSIFGNPYRVGIFGRALSVELYSRSIQGYWTSDGIPDALVDRAYQAHCEIAIERRKRLGCTVARQAEVELRGVDYVACWCAPEDLCHADVLLELANAVTGGGAG